LPGILVSNKVCKQDWISCRMARMSSRTSVSFWPSAPMPMMTPAACVPAAMMTAMSVAFVVCSFQWAAGAAAGLTPG